MTTPAVAPTVCDDPAVGRVSDLLIALERADPRRIVLRPIADIAVDPAATGDVCVYATVFVDTGDGRPPQPFALHEVRLAASCLADDPPFANSADLAQRLVDAALAAFEAAQRLHRSLN